LGRPPTPCRLPGRPRAPWPRHAHRISGTEPAAPGSVPPTRIPA